MGNEKGSAAMTEFINHLYEDQAIRSSERRDEKKQQIGVRIEPYSVRLLEQLCDRFDQSRTSMAQSLLAVAIYDAAQLVGIDTTPNQDDYRSALLDMGLAGALVEFPGSAPQVVGEE